MYIGFCGISKITVEAMSSEWDEKLDEILRQCNAVSQDLRVHLSNRHKQDLHSRIQLLLMDFEESNMEAAKNQYALYAQFFSNEHKSDINLEISGFSSEFLKRCAQIRQDLSLRKAAKKASKVAMFRSISVVMLSFLLGYPIYIVFALSSFLEKKVLAPMGIPSWYFPSKVIVKGFMQSVTRLSGATVYYSGEENVPLRDRFGKEQNSLILFSHASNLDSFMTAAVCPLPLTFVAKKELFKIPLFGQISSAYGMIPIDRSDLKAALKSYENAAERLLKEKTSIAISPEGTRAKSGLLAEFKKGPFHLAAKAKLPITPAVLYDAFDLWPPGQMFVVPGTVEVRFLPQIYVTEGDDHKSLLRKTRRAMLNGFLLNDAVPKKLAEHVEMYYLHYPLIFLFWIIFLKLGGFI